MPPEKFESTLIFVYFCGSTLKVKIFVYEKIKIHHFTVFILYCC